MSATGCRPPLISAWLSLSLLFLPFQTSEALTPELVADGDLVYVHMQRTYESASEVCSLRFRDLATPLKDALVAWRQRHADALVEMRRLSDDLRVASAASPPFNGLLSPERLDQLARMSWTDDLFHLASSTDNRARQRCEERHAELNNDFLTRINFDRAREAAKNLLAEKRAQTERYRHESQRP